MGCSRDFKVFEKLIIGTYDLDKLSPKLLDVILNAYFGRDIDDGCIGTLTTYDGFYAKEVVVKCYNNEIPQKPDYYMCSDEVWEQYLEKLNDKFNTIVKKFGWQ